MTRLRKLLLSFVTPVAMVAGLATASNFVDAKPYAGPSVETRLSLETEAAAEQRFADAPDGVDSMVTGPVSTAFSERQRSAGCDQAEWPNVPLACYPN